MDIHTLVLMVVGFLIPFLHEKVFKDRIEDAAARWVDLGICVVAVTVDQFIAGGLSSFPGFNDPVLLLTFVATKAGLIFAEAQLVYGSLKVQVKKFGGTYGTYLAKRRAMGKAA